MNAAPIMTCKLIWSPSSEDPELQLRIRPIREQWEARGPGLLSRLGKILPWLEIHDKIEVRLEVPQAGSNNRVASATVVHFEAVLANPIPVLPEVARLAYLLSLTSLYERLGEQPKLAAAMICPVIAAAEYVELAALDETTLGVAVEAWTANATQIEPSKLLKWWARCSEPVDSFSAWQTVVAEL